MFAIGGARASGSGVAVGAAERGLPAEEQAAAEDAGGMPLPGTPALPADGLELFFSR